MSPKAIIASLLLGFATTGFAMRQSAIPDSLSSARPDSVSFDDSLNQKQVQVNISAQSTATDSLNTIPEGTMLNSDELVTDSSAVAIPLTKEELKAQKKQLKAEEKEKKRKAREKNLAYYLANWEYPRLSGYPDIDAFLVSTSEMMLSFKRINENINFIRIETISIEDTGDGVTSMVKITDGDGNDLTPESTREKFVAIGLNLAEFAIMVPTAINAGTEIISKISDDPSHLLALLVYIKQIKSSIQALYLLTQEIPVTIRKVSEQSALLKQMKNN